MKRNFVKLIAAVTIATTTIGSNLVGVNAEEKDNSKDAIKVEQIQKIKSSVTTGSAVEVATTDIPKSILEKYDDYFKVNENIKNINDLINKVYSSLNNIDVKNNPNFSYLAEGKEEYKILCDIKTVLTKGDKNLKSIQDTIDIYDVYSELSKDGGFSLYINSGGEPYEKLKQTSDILEKYLINYDYKNVSKEKFKGDLESTLTSKLGDKFTVTYTNDEESPTFIIPTSNSTGYVYIDAYLLVQGNQINFNYETVLNKLNNNSSNNNNSSGGGSSHHSSSGGGSSHKDKSTIDKTTTDKTAENNNEVNNVNTNKANVVVNDNITKIVDANGQALTGWQQINNQWYLADTNGQALTGWQQVNGQWYLLEANGSMSTGWYKDTTGKWYLLQESGSMQRGWYKDTNGEWYLLEANGGMSTGWYKDTNGEWYLLQESGAMQRGWYQDTNGEWYLLQESGSMQRGWHKDTTGKWYYLNSDGSMAHDTYIDGYYVNSNGAWA